MKWLIGHWKGTGLGGVSEEIWAEPAGGVMMGMYRLILNGKPSFYEFIHLAEENGSLVMKLKHFNPDLTGVGGEGSVRDVPSGEARIRTRSISAGSRFAVPSIACRSSWPCATRTARCGKRSSGWSACARW